MKIRSDFVTNSSSVSFVITAKEEILKLNIAMHEGYALSKFYSRILDEFNKKGEKINVNGEELQSLKLTFLTNDWHFEIPETDDIISFYDFLENKDFESMSEEELYCYLYYAILNPSLIPDIGATKLKTY